MPETNEDRSHAKSVDERSGVGALLSSKLLLFTKSSAHGVPMGGNTHREDRAGLAVI